MKKLLLPLLIAFSSAAFSQVPKKDSTSVGKQDSTVTYRLTLSSQQWQQIFQILMYNGRLTSLQTQELISDLSQHMEIIAPPKTDSLMKPKKKP